MKLEYEKPLIDVSELAEEDVLLGSNHENAYVDGGFLLDEIEDISPAIEQDNSTFNFKSFF